MKVKSHYPPFCFESPVTGKKWIVCTGSGSGWIEVNRWYGWAELGRCGKRLSMVFRKI